MPSFTFRFALPVAALAACLLAGAASATPAAAMLPAAAVTPVPVKKQLDELAAAFHHARCSFNPLLFATANGDSRYDDQLGLSISPLRHVVPGPAPRKHHLAAHARPGPRNRLEGDGAHRAAMGRAGAEARLFRAAERTAAMGGGTIEVQIVCHRSPSAGGLPGHRRQGQGQAACTTIPRPTSVT